MVKETKMKQTEIALIPENWEVRKLGELGDVKMCRRIFQNQTSEYGEIPFFKIGTFGKEPDAFIKRNLFADFKTKFSYPEKGEILISAAGTIGRTVVYNGEESYYQDSNIVWINNKEEVVSNTLLKYILEIVKYNTEGGTIQRLYNNILKNTSFICPPLAEQEAIAKALSDCDSWIDSIEEVLAKKRLIKQGAMQELLTPKEDWEEISLIEIAEKKRDLFNDGDWIESEHIKADGIRLIQTGNIGVGKFLNRQNRKYINQKSFLDLKCKELFEGDLLICRLAEPAGRACIFPKTTDYKTVTSVDVTIFRPDVRKYNRDLLMYIMCTDEWFKNVIEQVGGTTHKRISRGNLGLIKVGIPKSLSEQTRIATILSDMDLEIEALVEKLHKARQIKQGMMQELLTGRVRLV